MACFCDRSPTRRICFSVVFSVIVQVVCLVLKQPAGVNGVQRFFFFFFGVGGDDDGTDPHFVRARHII